MAIADKNKYKHRIIDSVIQDYLEVSGAVCVEGPKWCGKTWTSSYHSASEFLVGDPVNNFQNRELAGIQPVGVLEGETPRLIDEWQEVPAIWDAVRSVVDRRGLKGQFILTGSSTPKRKGVMHSGAGRIASVRMHTMSLWESGDSSGNVSLKDICYGNFNGAVMTGSVSLEKLAYLVVRGGWPGNIGASEKNAAKIPESYIRSLIANDINSLDDSVNYDLHKVELLLRSLARNESTTVTNATLANDIRDRDGETVTTDSIAKYLSALNRMFLLSNQQPFSPNIRSSLRIKQSEKRHFCDPALACAILNLTPEKLINNLETFGFMFEAMVERDLCVYVDSFGGKLYHYQDYKGNEVDAVIETNDGEWCGIEIKLGANKIEDAARNLLKVKETIIAQNGKPPKTLCVICGLSNAAYQRSDGVYVVPITALKN